ncbi:MAG TPA: protein translocase subunit SecD [Polyangia bacterium]|jgi:preprotein translocase subunit SecD
MEKTWWWKFCGFLLVTLLAGAYLTPTFMHWYGKWDKAPAWWPKAFTKKIQQGLDLQGGLHLVYEVNMDKAVSDKADRLSVDLGEKLQKDKKVKATSEREVDARTGKLSQGGIVIKFANPAEAKVLDRDFMRDYSEQIEEISRDTAKGVVVLRMNSTYVENIKAYALKQGIETIRGRVDKFGVAEPTIIRKGDNIVVELPGLKQEDFERIRQLIGRTAQLEFKFLDEVQRPGGGNPYMTKISEVAKDPKYKDLGIEVEHDQWSEKDSGQQHTDVYLRAEKRDNLEKFFADLPADMKVPANNEIGYEEVRRGSADEEGAPGKVMWRTYLLIRRAEITGELLTDAEVTRDPQTNRPEVSVTFNREGAARFERVSGDNIGRKMAIILDERINSAPVIESRIGGGRARITMGGWRDHMQIFKESQDLVAVLRTGALPAPLRKTFETQVGPTLGKDAIDKAKLSMGIGGLAVILFMLLYYRKSGLIANIAMVGNMVFMMAILAGFESTLTLPGIAGLVLTIGMAVDANIIIYERIREELRLGKTPRAAVDLGFQRAFRAVLDGHVSNAVAGVVLYQYGTGPIRGFAVTLIIGIITNLFTSVLMSRWMFDILVARRKAAQTLSI